MTGKKPEMHLSKGNDRVRLPNKLLDFPRPNNLCLETILIRISDRQEEANR